MEETITLNLGKIPFKQQDIFICADELEQLYGGAKRGGKSVALAQKISLLLTNFPGNRGGLFRKNLTDLRESTLHQFYQVFPSELIIDENKTEHWIKTRTIDPRFPSLLYYGGLGEAAEVEKSKGKEFGFIAIDEPSEIDELTYLMLLAQLTWILPDGSRPPYMMLLACNPEPVWVHRRFKPVIDSRDGKNARHPDMRFVRSLPRDNPHLPKNYEEILRQKAPHSWVQKYLDGSWLVSEGMVFMELDDDTHFIQGLEDEYLRTMNFYAAIDHASSGVTCMQVVGIDPSDFRFSAGEYYAENQLISHHAAQMHKLLNEFNPKFILIDPSTAARTLQGGSDDKSKRQQLRSVIQEYRSYGIKAIPAHNALEMGLNIMKEFLHVNPSRVHPLRPETMGTPGWFINEHRCPNLIEELRSYRKIVSDTGEVEYRGSDHAIDPVRYIFLSRPKPGVQILKNMPQPGTLESLAQRTHKKWTDHFDKETRPSNTWF